MYYLISKETGWTTNDLTISSIPHFVPMDKYPRQTNSIKETRDGSYLSLGNEFQFPARLWNYSNKPITSFHRNQGAPQPLITTKPAIQSVFFHSVTEGNLCVALQGLWCLPTLDWESLWLNNCYRSHMSTGRSQVSVHPPKPRKGIPPSPTRWRGSNGAFL